MRRWHRQGLPTVRLVRIDRDRFAAMPDAPASETIVQHLFFPRHLGTKHRHGAGLQVVDSPGRDGRIRASRVEDQFPGVTISGLGKAKGMVLA